MCLFRSLFLALALLLQGATSAPVALGDKWMSLGDSHNFGYGTGPCRTPYHVIARIAQTKGIPGPTLPYTNIGTSNVYQDGVSGRSLAETRTHYDGRSERLTRTAVFFQESGNQNLSGQTTAAAFGATWDNFIDAILSNTPSAIIVYETAFSFGREGESFRNWDPYNDTLRAHLAARNLPEKVFLVETDRDIKALQAIIGNSNVWFQSNESNSFHYKSVGNLMIGVATLKTLGYTITMDDLADIDTSVVSATWKQEVLNVIAANYPASNRWGVFGDHAMFMLIGF